MDVDVDKATPSSSGAHHPTQPWEQAATQLELLQAELATTEALYAAYQVRWKAGFSFCLTTRGSRETWLGASRKSMQCTEPCRCPVHDARESTTSWRESSAR